MHHPEFPSCPFHVYHHVLSLCNAHNYQDIAIPCIYSSFPNDIFHIHAFSFTIFFCAYGSQLSICRRLVGALSPTFYTLPKPQPVCDHILPYISTSTTVSSTSNDILRLLFLFIDMFLAGVFLGFYDPLRLCDASFLRLLYRPQ